MRSGFRMRRGMDCPHCGKTQYQTQPSMWKSSMISLIPLILIPLVISFSMSVIFEVAILFVSVVFYLSILPFVLKLSNEEEPLW
ncbi:TIGR04104 family putative zinc finger protein [Halobacillus naozhouensis]